MILNDTKWYLMILNDRQWSLIILKSYKMILTSGALLSKAGCNPQKDGNFKNQFHDVVKV